MKYIMGIDLGTTGCKASLFEQSGRLAEQAYREYSSENYTGFIDCELVWEKTKEVIRECNSRRPEVQGVCITSFGESVILVDREGRPLGESVLYSAGGVDEEWRELERKIGREKIYQITGHISHPMYTVSRLLWYRVHDPELYGKTARFLFFSSYIAMRMGADCVAEDTHAARSMAYDVEHGCWSREILDAAGISIDLLPPVAAAGEVIGRVPGGLAEELGFNGKPLIIAGGQDQPCVALGMGAVKGGDAVYGLGTVECLSVVLDRYQKSGSMEESHLVCAPHVIPGKFLTYGVLYSGGNVIRELRDRLFRPRLENSGTDIYQEMFHGIDRVENRLLVIPHLFGSGTPGMNQEEGACVLGMRPDTAPEEILQAVLEGLAFDMRINIENMERAGIPVRQIRAAGGGAKSPEAMQVRADVLGQRLYIPKDVQAGARGVFFIAAKALGWLHDYSEIPGFIKLEETCIEPRKGAADKYKRKYEAYRAVQNWMF